MHRDLAQPIPVKSIQDSLRRRLAKGAAGTFGLKIASTLLALLTSLLLARLLGAAGYGAYAYAMVWVMLLAVPGMLGMDKLLVREIAANQTKSQWGKTRGLLVWANTAVIFVSIAIAALAIVIVWLLPWQFDAQMSSALLIALVMIPFVALTRARQASMAGFHRVVKGQLPERLIRPVLLILLVALASLALGDALSATWVIAINGVAVAVASFIGARQLYGSVPDVVKQSAPIYETRLWMQSALPLVLIGSLYAINERVGFIMLGAIRGAEDVGIYAVVFRGVELIKFLLLAVATILAPHVAGLYTSGNTIRLEGLLRKSSLISLLISLPIALALVIFGEWFLSLFGPDFVRGETALAILVAAQVFSAATGPVSMLLVMTGHQGDVLMAMGISAISNIALNAVLIPKLGLEGAAIAALSSLVIWNTILVVCAYRKLGINPTAVGKFKFLTGK